MDENRLFGNDTEYVSNMRDMVVRDRNHPSIAVW
jgi:beta-galactosidase/beta-glucuronidase